jgi:hypothetical protein
VRVFDNGTPSLSATGAINVVVLSRPLLSTPIISAANVTLTWSAIPSTSYRLGFKTNLNNATWNSFAGDVIATGTNATKVDTNSPVSTNRFYRVEVLP